MTVYDNSGLLPYPFCGGTAIVYDLPDRLSIECELCGIDIGEYQTIISGIPSGGKNGMILIQRDGKFVWEYPDKCLHRPARVQKAIKRIIDRMIAPRPMLGKCREIKK